MIYLASKYSADTDQEHEYNYDLALAMAMQLIRDNGLHVYSPIVHFHHMARRFVLPTNAEFWREINFHMIDLSEAVFVYCTFGWRMSKGVAEEIAYAEFIGKPIKYIYKLPYAVEIRDASN